MKVKFIKDLYSALGHYQTGETHELKHDDYTIKNWIEQGYCEAVKGKSKKVGEQK